LHGLINRLCKATIFCLLLMAPFGAVADVMPESGGAGNVGEASDPIAVIDSLHKSLLTVMKAAEATPPRQRFEALSSPVRRAYHMAVMIRVAAGPYWRRAEEADKTALTEAFTRFSVATYADRFDGYSGQRFETLGYRGGQSISDNAAMVVVETQLLSPDHAGSEEASKPVRLDYVLRKYDDRWGIVDVLLQGSISELAGYRSEYQAVLKDKGMVGLVGILNRKIKMLLGS